MEQQVECRCKYVNIQWGFQLSQALALQKYKIISIFSLFFLGKLQPAYIKHVIYFNIKVFIIAILFLFLLFIFYCSITVVLIYPPLLSPTLPTPHSNSQYPSCCPCPQVIHTCSLTGPFPAFPHYPLLLPSGHCQSVPCFHVSGSILFVCFIHQVPLISEIIWYLSLTTWLISLSIILFSSIHALSKGRSSFFLDVLQYSMV